jgi:hypothetical protein
MAHIHMSTANVNETPVRAALARVTRGYEVAIAEAITFELEIPMLDGGRVTESTSFGSVWLDASDLELVWALRLATR